MKLLLGVIATLVAASSAKVFFEEQFKDGKSEFSFIIKCTMDFNLYQYILAICY